MAYDLSYGNDVRKYGQVSARVLHADTITGSIVSGSTGYLTSATIPTVTSTTAVYGALITGSRLSGSQIQGTQFKYIIQTGSGNILANSSYKAITYAYSFAVAPKVFLNVTGSVGANLGPLITGSLSAQSGSTTGFIAFSGHTYGYDVGFEWIAIPVQ